MIHPTSAVLLLGRYRLNPLRNVPIHFPIDNAKLSRLEDHKATTNDDAPSTMLCLVGNVLLISVFF